MHQNDALPHFSQSTYNLATKKFHFQIPSYLHKCSLTP